MQWISVLFLLFVYTTAFPHQQQDNQFGSRASRSAVDQHVVDPPKAVETKSGAPVHVEQKKEAIKEREELEVPPPASNCDVPVPKQTKRERSPPRATNCDVPQPKNGEKHGPPPATNCDVPLPKPKQPTTGHGTSAVRSGIPKQGNTEHKPAKNFRKNSAAPRAAIPQTKINNPEQDDVIPPATNCDVPLVGHRDGSSKSNNGRHKRQC